MSILVTGAAGFIGSHFVIDYLKQAHQQVLSLDKLCYAGNLKNLAQVINHPQHHFIHGDIADRLLLQQILRQYQVQSIIHFAAQSHVDRSISDSEEFIHTNILGTYHLLEEARLYWECLGKAERQDFRFVYVGTDEVYGSLKQDDSVFTECSQYKPNNPYSASKAAADHLVRAWYQTYGLPTIITHCSNNYGPHQFHEKLIPHMIIRALSGKSLPIYGDGQHQRDWLYVKDHCVGLRAVLERGVVGEVYNFGSGQEWTNLNLVHQICNILDQIRPKKEGGSYQEQIAFVEDRLGHDFRYKLDFTKAQRELGWKPNMSLQQGLLETVAWYLEQEK